MVHTPRHRAAPQLLRRRQTKWTERWKRINRGEATGDWATPLAKRILKEELQFLAHGKCAFCEGALGAQAWLEVEHYVAKTVNTERAFEWTNLFPACCICNVRKSNEDHQDKLLKPDTDDPESHFWINPDSGKLEPHPRLDEHGIVRAELTIRLFDLQRGPLCENRLRRMTEVQRWVERSQRVNPENRQEAELLGQEWNALSDPRTEYKLALRYQLRLKGLNQLAELDKQKFEETRRES